MTPDTGPERNSRTDSRKAKDGETPLSDLTEAKLAIKETLYQYSLMVDRRRWELIDQVFTQDATIDYTSVGAGATSGPHREMLT
jgi:hypothetical protein